MHRPRLLILDEPTDGVDPVGRRDIRAILDRLTERGVTVFINSHLLAEVESFCDYVAILHKGRLALEGKISTLVSESGYRIEAAELPHETIGRIRELGASLAQREDAIDIKASSLDEANRVVDIVRASGGLLTRFEKATGSLEDVFMRVTATSERAA